MRAIQPQHSHLVRLSVLKALGVVVWIVLTVRLFHIQSKRAGFLEQAEQQHKCRVFLPAKRGQIFDRNHKALAINLPSRSFAVDPSAVSDPISLANHLVSILSENKEALLTRLSSKSSFVWLVRHADDHTARQIESRNLQGVLELGEMKRCYPLGYCLGQLLGYANIDNKGIEGTESELNGRLQGKPGFMVTQRDARGRLHPEVYSVRVAPQDGSDVVLTIDATYQMIAEEELEATVNRFHALGAIAVLMDPRTSEILAVAQYPFCDPNYPTRYDPHFRKNRAVTDAYEPGSTFKLVAAAAAIERNLFAPQDSIFCENGRIIVAGRPIEDAHKFGWLTFKDVIAHSSNIGMIKVGQRVGKAGLYHYVRDFGFGSRTGVDLAGEVEGIAHHPATWSKRSLATIAMGQEVSVTPLQLANAYCAIANKGRLMRPYAVSQVVDKQGQVLEETKPLCIRRVVSDSTAHTITRMLTAVVEEGTGIKAQIEGIAVAGKTGTAQKPRLDGRGYAPGEFVASFVGFLPADDPKLLCLVIVDTPRGLYWGSEAAAPAFKRMVDRILSLDSNPIRRRERVVLVDRNPKEDDLLIVPDLRGYLVFDAKRLLAGYHLTPATRGSGNRVREQSIAPGEWVKPATRIQLATQESPRDSVQATGLVPDVSGLSLRKAVAVLAESGLDVRIRGSGIVRNQQPAKGTSVHAGTLCVIEGDCSDAAGAGPMRLSSLLE